MIRFVLLLLVVCFPLTGGEYADAFLKASIHPQSQALGHSTVARGLTAGHALNNPAGFRSDSLAISTLYQTFAGLSENLTLEAVFPLSEDYRIGLTVVHSMVSDLTERPDLYGLSPQERRDSVRVIPSGNPIAYRENAAILSLAREYRFDINLGWKFFKIPCRMPIGLSVKYFDKLLEENRGLGVGFDMGTQIFFNLEGMSRLLKHTEFGLGYMFTDILNSPVYWTTKHQDAIKRQFHRGASITQNVGTTGTRVSYSTAYVSGAEGGRRSGLELSFRDLFDARLGHDGEVTSFGLGIGLKKFIIDYSFSRNELANLQRIGIKYHF